MRTFALLVACAALSPSLATADERSEQAAADLLHKRLQNENPNDARLLESMHGKDIIVVAGSMDHIEQVLAAARIQYTIITPEQVAQYPLKSNMIVMVNCPGTLPDAGVHRIERFVRAGGLLYTTDWSLNNLVEKAFPRTIAWNQKATGSEVTPVSIDKQNDNIMSQMLLSKGHRPEWWLEGSSRPIAIIDKQRVEVLAHSDEMAKRYGAGAVVVHFKWEDGDVIHVVSHFYRQMETRGPKVAATKAVDQYEGLTDAQRQQFKQSPAAAAPSSDVESSYAFQRMTTNIVTGKQHKNAELRRSYNLRPKAPVVLRAAPSPTAKPVAPADPDTTMKVLERNGDQVRVRDDRGEEGWVPSAALH
jgi:hypothetical protein